MMTCSKTGISSSPKYLSSQTTRTSDKKVTHYKMQQLIQVIATNCYYLDKGSRITMLEDGYILVP